MTCVGEVGLDGSPEFKGFWEIQEKVFAHVLQSCSKAGGKTFVHSQSTC